MEFDISKTKDSSIWNLVGNYESSRFSSLSTRHVDPCKCCRFSASLWHWAFIFVYNTIAVCLRQRRFVVITPYCFIHRYSYFHDEWMLQMLLRYVSLMTVVLRWNSIHIIIYMYILLAVCFLTLFFYFLIIIIIIFIH